MGRMVIRAIHEAQAYRDRRAGAAELARARRGCGNPAGLPAPPGVKITDDPLPLMLNADGVIDFSSPAASVELAALAAQARIADVIGTTGLSEEDLDRIDAAARHAPIVRSGNMSLGVNLLAALVQRAAPALGAEFDIEIVEMHHRMKVDAPSGTALMLGEAAADGRGVELAAHSARGRDGFTGARKAGDIGFAALRGGTVVGDHSVIFAGDGERIVLSHHAEDRAIFARGAREGGAVGARPQAGALCDGGRAGARGRLKGAAGVAPTSRRKKAPVSLGDPGPNSHRRRSVSAAAREHQQHLEHVDEVEIERQRAEDRLFLRRLAEPPA